ncbi:unnamed protein product, partial [Adineta steineri]
TTYAFNFCPHLSSYILTVASFDRYCSSSLNPQQRRFSNVKTARWVILIVILFTGITTIPSATNFNVDDTNNIGCTSSPNVLFNQVYLIIQVILLVIISPFLMILFGFLTIYNIHKSNQNHGMAIRYRPSEGQLARMLIVQVSSQIILSLPFVTILFMTILPISFSFTIMFYFLFIIFKIPFYITFITPFFLYILSAPVYRDELIQIMKKLFRIQTQAAVHPVATLTISRPFVAKHH